MQGYIWRPAIVAMLISGCILVNTARAVSRTSVMVGIDGLHGGWPEIGLVSAVALIRVRQTQRKNGRIRFVVGQSSS